MVDLDVLLRFDGGDANDRRAGLVLIQLRVLELPFGGVLRGFPTGLLVEAFGALEARHDLSGLLLLELRFAGVAIDEVGALPEAVAVRRRFVVRAVLDCVLLPGIDSDGLRLAAGSFGALRLCAGSEATQDA